MNQIIYRKRKESEFSINLTNACPNACVFCVKKRSKNWFMEQQFPSIDLFLKNDPSINEILYAVREELKVVEDPVKLIKFCGYGEPILKCDVIIKVAILIKEYSPNSTVQVNTSGWPYFLQYNSIEKLLNLKESGVNSFSVSLNAPNKELYNKIVRPGNYPDVENAFNNTIKFIVTARKLGFKIKITFVDIPLIHNLIANCINLANNLGVEYMIRQLDEV